MTCGQMSFAIFFVFAPNSLAESDQLAIVPTMGLIEALEGRRYLSVDILRSAEMRLDAYQTPGGSSSFIATDSTSGFDLNFVLGDGMAGNAAIEAAVDYVEHFFESYFTDDITVTIDVDFDSNTEPVLPINANAGAAAASLALPYETVRGRMLADATTDELDFLQVLPEQAPEYLIPEEDLDSVGVTVDRATVRITSANAKALGISFDNPDNLSDAEVIFSRLRDFDFDPVDGVGINQQDFTGILIHETVHALGFLSAVDEVDRALGQNLTVAEAESMRPISPRSMDLFRVLRGAVVNDAGRSSFGLFQAADRILSPGVSGFEDQVFYDGNFFESDRAGLDFAFNDGEIPLSTGAFLGDGQQASHFLDDAFTGINLGIMDPATGNSALRDWRTTDQRVLALLGWDLNPANVAIMPGGAVLARGSEGRDTFAFDADAGGNVFFSTFTSDSTHITVRHNGFSAGQIFVRANGGRDSIGLTPNVGPAESFLTGDRIVHELNGGTGNDDVVGSIFDDNIDGFGGDDVIFGRFGNDVLAGFNGNDALVGEEGNDTLGGGTGDDILSGGDGNDVLFGRRGDDDIAGGDGDDIVDGAAGNDTLSGQAGNDTILGREGNDSMAGGDGNDELDGGTGFDWFQGNAGNDLFIAADGEADEAFFGGTGDDFVVLDEVEDADAIVDNVTII